MVIECAHCHAALGDGPRRAPIHVDGELWCPRCFVHTRAPMEIGRFAASHYAAILCSPCGWESADFGLGRCMQCSSRFVLALPPAPERER